jgi:hypothetical protein
VLLLLLALAANDGGIREARLEAAIGEGPDVAVRLAFRVEPSTGETVSFSALEIDGVGIEDLAASTSGTPISVKLMPRIGPKREGSILLPQGTDAFELHYLVRGGAERTEGGLRVRLPCVILDRKLAETRTGLFSSSVALPQGMQVVDSYPAQFLAGEEGAYQWELPLVPAFLSFRASSEAELFTRTRLTTLAVVVLFLSVGAVAVHRARSIRP